MICVPDATPPVYRADALVQAPVLVEKQREGATPAHAPVSGRDDEHLTVFCFDVGAGQCETIE
jgi:hypothetical protein